MNDPGLTAIGRKLSLSPKQEKTWREHTKKQMQKGKSPEAAGKYANHVKKAAIHRKMRDRDKIVKGQFFNG